MRGDRVGCCSDPPHSDPHDSMNDQVDLSDTFQPAKSSPNPSSTRGFDASVVALTGFAYACLAFATAVLVVIPAAGSALPAWGWSDLSTRAVLLGAMLGLPILASLLGVAVGSRLVAPHSVAAGKA